MMAHSGMGQLTDRGITNRQAASASLRFDVTLTRHHNAPKAADGASHGVAIARLKVDLSYLG